MSLLPNPFLQREAVIHFSPVQASWKPYVTDSKPILIVNPEFTISPPISTIDASTEDVIADEVDVALSPNPQNYPGTNPEDRQKLARVSKSAGAPTVGEERASSDWSSSIFRPKHPPVLPASAALQMPLRNWDEARRQLG